MSRRNRRVIQFPRGGENGGAVARSKSQFRKAVLLGDVKQKAGWPSLRELCSQCEGQLTVDGIWWLLLVGR